MKKQLSLTCCFTVFVIQQCCRVWLSKILQVCQSLCRLRLRRVRESASLRTCGQWVWSHTSCSPASPCSAASTTRQHSATSRTTAGSSERSVLELVAVNFCFIRAQELLFCLWPVHVNILWWYHILEFNSLLNLYWGILFCMIFAQAWDIGIKCNVKYLYLLLQTK